MKSSRRTSLTIKYNGRNVTTALNEFLENFQYIDVASGEADTLDLVLSDDEHRWINSWFPVEGDYVEAKINVHDWLKRGDNRSLNCGRFYVDDYGYNGPGDVANIGSITKPVDSDFSKTEKNKTWKNTTLEGIAKIIAKSAGVALYYEAPNYKIANNEQSGQTDMNFLFDLCSNYCLAMKLYNQKIVIFDEVKYEEKPPKYVIDKSYCKSYTPHTTLAGMYDGVKISYTNTKNNKTLHYKYMINKSGKRILSVKEKADSYADAEVIAKSKLRAANKSSTTLSITVMGDVKYVAGNCAEITGFAKFNGKYYIDKVTHELSEGYTCTLEMHKTLGITVGAELFGKNKVYQNGKHEIGDTYAVVTSLTGYYTAVEAKNNKSSGNPTGRVNKGKYYVFNYHVKTGMINVTKVKGVPGSWINPSKNN